MTCGAPLVVASPFSFFELGFWRKLQLLCCTCGRITQSGHREVATRNNNTGHPCNWNESNFSPICEHELGKSGGGMRERASEAPPFGPVYGYARLGLSSEVLTYWALIAASAERPGFLGAHGGMCVACFSGSGVLLCLKSRWRNYTRFGEPAFLPAGRPCEDMEKLLVCQNWHMWCLKGLCHMQEREIRACPMHL